MTFRSRGGRRVVTGLVVVGLVAGVGVVSGGADPLGAPARVAVVGAASPLAGGVTGLTAPPTPR